MLERLTRAGARDSPEQIATERANSECGPPPGLGPRGAKKESVRKQPTIGIMQRQTYLKDSLTPLFHDNGPPTCRANHLYFRGMYEQPVCRSAARRGLSSHQGGSANVPRWRSWQSIHPALVLRLLVTGSAWLALARFAERGSAECGSLVSMCLCCPLTLPRRPGAFDKPLRGMMGS